MLKRVRRLGSDCSREDVGLAEGSMGLNGVRDETKETEVAARGTAVERVGGRESRRASEGGIRGILSRSVRLPLSTRVWRVMKTHSRELNEQMLPQADRD